MNNSGSKTILIIVLILAAVLALGAGGLWWYNNNIADDDTDTDQQTTETANKCNTIYLKDAEGNDIAPGTVLKSSETVIIGSEFQIEKELVPDVEVGEGVNVTGVAFNFTINSETPPESVTKMTVEDRGNNYIFYPEFEYSDFGDETTLSIVADIDPGDNVTLENSIGSESSCSAIFEVEVDTSGVGDGNTGSCIAAGETGTVDENQCCEGLERVDNCTEPDSDNQCTLEVPDCFVCVESTSDGQCGAGENICNSNDCEVEEGKDDEPTDEPTASCVADGETATSGVCCSGLNQVTCAEPDSNNQCTASNEECFKCISATPNDGSCDTGENFCNSYNDCQGQIYEEGKDTDYEGEGASDFSVSVSANDTCVERISPNNSLVYTIAVTNNTDQSQDISDVTNKLPLGFRYIQGSANINGEVDTNDEYLTINNIGDSQELVWSTQYGWSVGAGDTFTIEFDTVADSNTLSGEALNEVVVTPVNLPSDTNALREAVAVTVAQSCSTPQTSIMDELPTKIVAGIAAVIVAMIFYLTSAGEGVSTTLASTGVAKKSAETTRMFKLRLFNPREYFEEKFRKKDKD
jgi:uncharacterized repeat protein (TIGR01451 family)